MHHKKVGLSLLVTGSEIHSIIFIYTCLLQELPQYITSPLKFKSLLTRPVTPQVNTELGRITLH